jgi:hypothetical protein
MPPPLTRSSALMRALLPKALRMKEAFLPRSLPEEIEPRS